MTEPENQAEALDEKALAAAIDCWMSFIPADRPDIADECEMVEYIARENVKAVVSAYLASLPEAPAVPVDGEMMPVPYKLANNLYRFLNDLSVAAVIAKGMHGDITGNAHLYAEALKRAFYGKDAALQSSLPVKAAAVDGEIDRLRKALIAAGRHVGAGLADDVSTDFLMLVPEEVRLVMEQHRAALASQHAVEGEAVAWAEPNLRERLIEDGGVAPVRSTNDFGYTMPLYATPRPAVADAGVREAMDILDGLDADIGLLKTAVEADDPKRELKIRFGDIGATIRNLRSSLSLAAKREQAR